MVDVVVIGAGAMGRLHARTVTRHPQTRLVEVVDTGPPFDGRADLAIVATPATTHVDVALPQLVKRWCLVEKPLAPTTTEARRLLHPRCRVGFSERFLPAFEDGLPKGHHEVWRCVPRSARGRDVDAMTDLMVHDVDLVLRHLGPAQVRRSHLCFDHAQVELEGEGWTARLVVERAATKDRRWVVEGVPLDLALGQPDPLTRQLDALLNAMNGGPSEVATPEEALEVLEVLAHARQRS